MGFRSKKDLALEGDLAKLAVNTQQDQNNAFANAIRKAVPLKAPSERDMIEAKTANALGSMFGVQPPQTIAPTTAAAASTAPEEDSTVPQMPWGSGPSGEELALQKALLAKVKESSSKMGDDIERQRKLSELLGSRRAGVDISPTLQFLYGLAGKKSGEYASAIKSAAPEDYDYQAELQKALGGVVNSEDKLSDNKQDELKMRLGFAQDKSKGAQDKQAYDMYKKFADGLSPETATGRKNFGKAYDALSNIERTEALIRSVDDPNKLTATNVGELYESLQRVLTGAAGSEGRLEAISQKTLGMDASKIKSYFVGRPVPANMGEFVNQISHIMGREKAVFQHQIDKAKNKVYETYGRMVEGHPTFGPQIRALNKEYGVPLTVKDIKNPLEEEAPAASPSGATQSSIPDFRNMTTEQLRAYTGAR